MNLYDDKDFYEAYSHMSRSEHGLSAAGEWYVLEKLFPDLQGKTMLDLGCGYGWHCKYAAEHGAASVLGIDQSEKMLKTAKDRNSDPVISYKCIGITDYQYPENTFDFVLSNLVLHYVHDLNDIYRKVYRCLKKDGIFLFNIEHPVFTSGIDEDWLYNQEKEIIAWPIENYYYPGKRTTKFLGHEVVKEHHTLTQILQGLLNTGFEIEAVQEPQPQDPEKMPDEMRRPMMLIVKARRR